MGSGALGPDLSLPSVLVAQAAILPICAMEMSVPRALR